MQLLDLCFNYTQTPNVWGFSMRNHTQPLAQLVNPGGKQHLDEMCALEFWFRVTSLKSFILKPAISSI